MAVDLGVMPTLGFPRLQELAVTGAGHFRLTVPENSEGDWSEEEG